MGEKVKITPEDLHSLSSLMSLPENEFIEHFKGKDLGYLLSMKNFTAQMFEDARKMKNRVIESYPKMKGDKKVRAKDLLDNFYNVLQNLENKFELLSRIEKERRELPLN